MANKPVDSIFSKRAIFKAKFVNYKNRINIGKLLIMAKKTAKGNRNMYL